jgi:hypothetical protein
MIAQNALAVKPDANVIYGDREEISALAKRIKTMLPGGDKLSDNESLALAQVATVTRLNPFVGEVWYIPGKGPMVGIKGARRLENEETRAKNSYSWMQFDVIAPEESGAPDPTKVFRAYKCTINDGNATKAYLAVFHDALEMLCAAQSKDPYLEAKEICGPRPVWEGYGFSLIGEPSRMNPDALARKRAEADALKKRIVLPFGMEVAESDGGYIEGEAYEAPSAPTYPVPRTTSQTPEPPSATIERPLAPETLRSWLAAKVNEIGIYQSTPEQLGLMVGMMELAFAPDKDAAKIHRSCIRFLWGYDSTKKMSGPQVKATLDWLAPVKDSGGSYLPDDMAVKELHAVWTAANVEAGQEALPL